MSKTNSDSFNPARLAEELLEKAKSGDENALLALKILIDLAMRASMTPPTFR